MGALPGSGVGGTRGAPPALLEEADIQMDELCGCLDPEAEVEDGKQLLTWEELRSELEAVAGALEASEQDAVPR